MKKQRRSAAEIIATFYCMDLAEMSTYRYQPTQYVAPAIYSLGPTDYVAAPSNGRMRKGYCNLEWEQIGEIHGRPIFIGHEPA